MVLDIDGHCIAFSGVAAKTRLYDAVAPAIIGRRREPQLHKPTLPFFRTPPKAGKAGSRRDCFMAFSLAWLYDVISMAMMTHDIPL
ncbi:MAG: hypothetical protein LBI62_02865 [Candidatus Accumulibacter sp.]|jgi:hypothetical protein|nr:hypothetical protein [Accumulibacter sp.]